MAVTRSTVSFNEQNWGKIKDAKNKSKLINRALAYYFAAQNYMMDKEREFLSMVESEWEHYVQTGESYSHEETFS